MPLASAFLRGAQTDSIEHGVDIVSAGVAVPKRQLLNAYLKLSIVFN